MHGWNKEQDKRLLLANRKPHENTSSHQPVEPEPESGKQREPATEDTVWMPLPFSQRPALQQKKGNMETNQLPPSPCLLV